MYRTASPSLALTEKKRTPPVCRIAELASAYPHLKDVTILFLLVGEPWVQQTEATACARPECCSTLL